MELKNRVAIITGGARGIGKATALSFAKEGAAVAIWDLNETAGQAVVQEIIQQGGKAMFVQVNTSDLAAVEVAAQQVAQTLGRIDILVNNAGITRDATLKKMSSEQWQQVIDVNLTGVFNCTKAVVPYMEQNAFGRIINASSVVALYGNFGQSNYAATKAGVIAMTQVWARELGRKGITVNAVAPGFIATELIKTIPEKIVNSLTERTPLGRLGTPEDIANAYVYLASDKASFITGTVISVDGGITI
ncbi:MAG: 3-oxoacyl-[acyl-carrier-protein] reductase [Sphingobacteriales bacterium]|nr:3-oxoacyl-[acyl-carrier-protein] reductase [Sphingobacteriales bacterium]